MRLDVEVDADEMLDVGGDIICHAGSDGIVLCVVRELVVAGESGESRWSDDWSGRNVCGEPCCDVWIGCGTLCCESDLGGKYPCSRPCGTPEMCKGEGLPALSICDAGLCCVRDGSRPWSVCSDRCVERLLDRDR